MTTQAIKSIIKPYQRVNELTERSHTMKYIIDLGNDVLLLTAEELHRYSQRLWEEHNQVLYLDEVVQDSMYFGVMDA